jgi:hypothetical protein
VRIAPTAIILYLEWVNEFLHALISGLILVKFDTGNVDMMPWSSCELCENWCSESHISLMGVNVIVSVFLHFSLKLM